MSIAKNIKETFLEEIIDNLSGNTRELPVDCKPRTREEVLLAEIEKNTRELKNDEPINIDLSNYYTKEETNNLVEEQTNSVINDSNTSSTNTWSSQKIVDYVATVDDVIFEEANGSVVTVNNSVEGYLKNIEILGNTIQDIENLADIRSVGDTVECQELYEIPVLSCGKNLFDEMNFKRLSWGGTNWNLATLPLTSDGNYQNYNAFQTNLRLKPNTTYTLKFKWRNVTGVNGQAHRYIRFQFKDVTNKRYSASINGMGGFDPNTDSHYNLFAFNGESSSFVEKSISFTTPNEVLILDKLSNQVCEIKSNYIQLEEGTVATPYEPYQEDKLTILSPVQLEKVGDVADRIICKDGVWGVEKNVKTMYTKEFASLIGTYEDKGDAHKWGLTLNTPKTFLLANFLQIGTLSTEPTQTQVMLYDHGTNREFRIAFKKSDFPNFDIKSNVVDYLSDETRFIKIIQQPTFIPLPHDQQVKLRTFANKTNISFLTEIEGTIKAQVPKSLGATVNTHTEQIRSLNNELNRVKKLEESTVSTVTTESDFTTVEATSNGYFDDVKLEGKTLVNLLKQNGTWTLGANTICHCFHELLKPLEVGKTYTYFYFNLPNTITQAYLGTASGDIVLVYWGAIKKAHSFIATEERATLTSVVPHFKTNGTDTLTTSEIENIKVVLLEGDHTQNSPSFFEGLKSVGQSATTSEDGVDEIVVSSVNENLVPSDWDYKFQCFGDIKVNQINTRTFEIVNTNTADGVVISKNFINKFCHDNKVVFDFYSNQIGYFYVLDYGVSGENYKPIQGVRNIEIGRNVFVVDVNEASGRIAFRFNNNIKNSTMIISDFSIKTSENSNNVNHQSDKKRLLYYNEETQTWEKPILRQWDSIEKHADGKYYYHQRSGEVVLNGSEDWSLPTLSTGQIDTNWETETHIAFRTSGLINPKVVFWGYPQTCICDRLKVGILNNTTYILSDEFIGQNSLGLDIKISKSKLSTQDVTGFKQWLQANPVTVVYQLAQEKVYECTNIDLITYANETNFIVESGTITPKTTLKVHNNISNVVSLLQKKVSVLESNMTSYMITQNRMQLASTYSADSVTFKVDYALCSEEVEYNEDLYNLILNNILVGKDNYNYDKMFNLILDYVTWGQLSFENFDTLVGLMDIQHNPPIDEEVTEEI